MKLQQMRYLCEIVDQGLNVSKAAAALHTAQPGISRQLRLLEQELGVVLLKRNTTRVVGITEIGHELLPRMRQMLLDADAIRRRARESINPKKERLSIATTHTFARYVLPRIFKRFVQRYPNVSLSMHQATSVEIAKLLKSGEVDIGLSTATLVDKDALTGITLIPSYRMGPSIITPPKHPLLGRKRPIELEDLLPFPLIFEEKSSLGQLVRRKFDQNEMEPNIVVRAIDSDVIKAYVDGGFGIAVIKNAAYSKTGDKGLRAIPATHLFGQIVSYAMLLKRRQLEPYMQDFISMVQAEGGYKAIKG